MMQFSAVNRATLGIGIPAVEIREICAKNDFAKFF
jgi:hypothetical protein